MVVVGVVMPMGVMEVGDSLMLNDDSGDSTVISFLP